jgi:hypothetical protein
MTFKTFLHLFIISIIAFVINFFLVENVVPNHELVKWTYSIANLYSMFFVFSVVIMSLLLFVRTKNLDYVGYTYLIATSVKMGIAYFLLRPILATTTDENSTEKINFFIVFICFLAIETLLTIRILNNKQ